MPALLFVLIVTTVAARPSGGTGIPPNSLGYEVEISDPAAVAAAGAKDESSEPAEGEEPKPPLLVRVGVAWSYIEESSGSYRWDPLDTVVTAALEAGHDVIINAHGTNPLYPVPGQSLRSGDTDAIRAWTSFLRELARRYADRVRLYEVGRFHDRDGDRPAAETARDYAFVFKQSSVTIKSEDPDALVSLGTIAPGSGEFASALFTEEIAPYTDALAASFDGSDAARDALAKLSSLLLAQDPSAKIWITGVRLILGGPGYGDLLRGYGVAMEREAGLVTFEDPADAQGRPFHLAAMERARDRFAPAFAPLVESGRGVRVVSATGEALPGARASRFFDADTKTVLMLYDGGQSARRGDFGVFIVDTTDLAEPALHDLTSGESSTSVTVQKDPNSGVSRLALPLAEYPLVLSYRRFTSPEYAAEGERLDVTGERVPTAEEIIAKHQAAQAAQDALLKSVSAGWEETWHFTAGAGGSVDVTWKGSYYLDPNIGAEFEQKEIYFNGVRWKMETFPELPFVISEKTWSVPLKITLSKDFRYTYEGTEEVDGHDCYLLSFESTDPEGKKLRGRVWIDKDKYVRVRLQQVQGELPDPLVSNDQTDTYDQITGPDGYTYWVFARSRAQTIYATLGVNLAVNKEVALHDFVINGPSFEQVRGQALASKHVMVRDTEKGLRYLAPDANGERRVKNEVSHSAMFWLAGIFYDHSLDYPLPIAGFDYFDSNVLNTGAQANAFVAGLFNFGTYTDPRLFGSKFDGSADAVMQVVGFTNHLYREGTGGDVDEVQAEEVTSKTQALSLSLGRPFAKFFKIKGEGWLRYVDYGRTEETAESFVEPRDTYVRSGVLSADFNRKAWGVSFSHEWSQRTRHEPWGAPDPNTGRPATGPGADFIEGASDFVRYSGSISKEFYLPMHQKVLAQVTGVGGRDLDRFSKYTVGFFDTRIHGFAGSGLRYTNGAVSRLLYSFNLADVIRFDAGFDYARVKDRQFGGDFQDFTGFGIGGNFMGKWGLIFRFDWGIAVDSDISDFKGQQEILFGVLKLFKQR
jgi:hypothetical protein